jgi:CxxC motif-containing protein
VIFIQCPSACAHSDVESEADSVSDEEVILIQCPSACAHSDVESEADSVSDEEVIFIQCPSACAHSDVESEADSVVSTIYSVFANGSEACPDHPWDTESVFFGDVEEGGY